jgi:drug/metabolite transporter (DMT)-like permease
LAPRFTPTTRGILFCLMAVILFTVLDAMAKWLTSHYPPVQVVWARYASQAALVFLLLVPRGTAFLRTRFIGLQLTRSMFQFAAGLCFFLALPHIGLAEATALVDLNPVLITLGAALFLGERIGLRRALGVAAALIGALIVIRPGLGVFQPAALLPLGTAFFYAGYALLTRVIGERESPWTSLFYSAFFGSLAAGLMLPGNWQPVALGDLWRFVFMGAVGTVAQLFLIRAFSLAPASVIAPFGYVGLIFASLWGWLFFGQLPDIWTAAGATLIVAAGLYVWARETAQARAQRAP